jgi:RNA binding exosome subunit
MSNPDPNPLPYGAMQYYQVHYIIQIESEENQSLLSKCQPVIKGHFGNKRVVDVKWTGEDNFRKILQADTKLTEMLKEVMLKVGEIRIDPQDDHIRIYGKWGYEDSFQFSDGMLEIADRIAMHIKEKLGPLQRHTNA